MGNLIRNNWDSLKKMLSSIIGILGAILTVVNTVKIFSSTNISNINVFITIMSSFLLIVALIGLSYSNVRLNQRWKGLILLAHRGHIHTIRMILMRDYHKSHNEDETILSDITKTNDFTAESAVFSFSVTKSKNGISDVLYSHSFSLKSKHKGEKLFYPWIFGDNNAKPQECFVKIGVDGEKRVLTPCPVRNPYVDYPVNEGIYTVGCNLGNMEKGQNKDIIFTYKRFKAYEWSRDELFVIYPKCFAKTINYASFKVEFYDNVSEKVGIRLTELYCNGRKAKEIILSNFTEPKIVEDGEKRKTIYIAENIKINENNVYIITITDPNRYNDKLNLFTSYVQESIEKGYSIPDENSIFKETVIINKKLWDDILRNIEVKNIINKYNNIK